MIAKIEEKEYLADTLRTKKNIQEERFPFVQTGTKHQSFFYVASKVKLAYVQTHRRNPRKCTRFKIDKFSI
jgi:hypothetical protein